ncbi:MAG: glycine--tRNA ligase subunit beta [Chromatiales bacterium]
MSAPANQTDDLLIEIGTEELPPKALRQLAEALAAGLDSGLEAAGLSHAAVRSFATPRRLAVLVAELPPTQPEREVLRRGPPVNAAFDREGNPMPAAAGFAQSCGVTIAELERLKTDKGEWLAYRAREPGGTVAEVTPAIIEQALGRLPIPKRMRWGSSHIEFARPVHWVVLLYGTEMIEAEILGVRTNRYTLGHRFHHPAPIHLDHPRHYEQALLERGYVVSNFETRRERIREQVLTAARQEHAIAHLDADLLDEVTALTEWPVALTGSFEPRFLALPSEVLIATMQDHQRYFPLWEGPGTLKASFVAVANLESKDPDAVRQGNQRVIRPRLNDAEFFWNQDRAQRLDTRIELLTHVIFQKDLGSLHDKTRRVCALATEIAALIGGNLERAHRAAELSRCDLMTLMVGEFPRLQGLMGSYYALHDGEPKEVAVAIHEMYLPRHAGDALPQSRTGQALAIADRLDTLTGIFGIGQPPTGEKDPYALRRAALGVLRIILEQRLDLDLDALLRLAVRQHGGRFHPEPLVDTVYAFMIERLRSYSLENGVRPDVFEAVQATRPTRPLDFGARLRAVNAFRSLPAAESLAAANKRIANILRKANGAPSGTVNKQALSEPAEQALYARLRRTETAITPLLDTRDYAQAMTVMSDLREPVDAFFDSVLVMCDDASVRANRLALLSSLRALFLRVADISRLQD